VRRLLFRLFALAVLGLAAYMGSFLVYPDVGELVRKNPSKTAFMEWREAQWAEKGEKKRITQRWAPLSQVSPLLLKAVLIGEDDKFYQHEGFDYEALEQAFEKNLKAGRFKAGASTISQQLTKNLFLSPEKSLTRKLKEAILTWRLENALSKRRILELYVNVAEWGDGIFGIEAAARRYYGKPASALSSMEAARLASVLPNPIRFNPLSEQKYVTFRANLIHSIMVRRGIAIEDFQEVMNAPEGASGGVAPEAAPPASAEGAQPQPAATPAEPQAAQPAAQSAGQPPPDSPAKP